MLASFSAAVVSVQPASNLIRGGLVNLENIMSSSNIPRLAGLAFALAGLLATGLTHAHSGDARHRPGAGHAVIHVQVSPFHARPAPPRFHSSPRHPQYVQPTRWDHDGDGIRNRHDRLYNPRWDRDGDGIRNRNDPVYNPRWDRDGDGIPNRHDRRPNVPGRY